MIQIEIDYDLADEITRKVLLETYIGLKSDLKKAIDNPGAYHPEDAESWAKTLVAIEALGEWFFYNFEEELAKAIK